jgi:hypothetical protein
MLYDPKWDKNSLIGLRDWLAQQPADTPYTWSSCKTCVVGMYLEAMGDTHLRYPMWCSETPGAHMAVAECFSDMGRGALGRVPMTLGDALANLDKWLAAHPVTA